MDNDQEKLNAIALTQLNYFSLAGLLELYRKLGSATAVVTHRDAIQEVIPDASQHLIRALQNLDEPLKRAEAELEYDKKHGIQVLTLNDPQYPQRLKDVDDAPLVLFYKGTADFNQARVIAIVGTRHCTSYGQDLIHKLITGLKTMCPRLLVISGLAYGVDITAHRQSLSCGYETIGVLAHGLDELYPSSHRDTANRMVTQGGLITEFLTQTRAEKINFVRRNRIIAGMSDATILIESAAKGGGLITTGIAQSYGRDVFAFPGPVGATYSAGCNYLIRDNGAGLITCADDLVKAMGWEMDARLVKARHEGIERQIFPHLSPEEQTIVKVLRGTNDLQINLLTVRTGLSISQLTALLFELEMKGIVKEFAGGIYHLLL
ncbi:MAG: DNA-processing protein DprA [Prevotella sp.]|jgi:DNA processing protein|nr:MULTISPECIES: DNA-processing protein DprA [unclassified Prevotella]MCH3969559.1 DNA-processing protein DprA [Prevotella sp.]MCH4018944.1 DNA-processing protein DprA [Prevotella sp.]MCH4186437.1 DNA-processing protein DprA [Prevotella sp.]MCH4216396.1 DNA-processing protein DprA [Prevotella sp.]MCH4251230.1 DNA-processing protein DprA [Prevotella sp.]